MTRDGVRPDMLVRALFLVYDVLWLVILPLAVIRLFWKSRRQPTYACYISERLSWYTTAVGAFVKTRPIWVHAVSVGETRAAEPLIKALLARGEYVVLTHMTPTGRATGTHLYADAIQSGRLLQLYLPYDFSWLVRNFYRVIRPKFGLVMETEAWPRLLMEACRQQLPLILVNARLSEKSFRNFSKYGFLAKFLMACFYKILAQTPLDADRFKQLGCNHVSVSGNLKFDVRPNEDLMREATGFKRLLGHDLTIFCAASTREGEETIILSAWQKFLERNPGFASTARLLIVPRHPERFDEVAELIRTKFLMARKSQATSKELADAFRDGSVVLGDTMGQMTFYYALCDVVVMGGSLAPLGGQNFIEACAMGRPILLGRHTFNFQQAAIDAIEMGAALRVEDEGQLIQAMGQLMSDLPLYERMSASALDYSLAHTGAINRILEELPH